MLSIPRLPESPALPGADLLRVRGLACPIATVNWPEFGRVEESIPPQPAGSPLEPWSGQRLPLPVVDARIAHDGSRLHLLFEVLESQVRAVCAADQEPVWQDSCVELFVSFDPAPGEPEGYYNFEFNCIGRCLSAFGPDRHQRTSLPATALETVARRPSPWQAPFGLREGPQHWELQVAIPVSAFVRHAVAGLDGRALRFNLYKCGDALPRKHYLTAFPVKSERPDYHRPECFMPARCAP